MCGIGSSLPLVGGIPPCFLANRIFPIGLSARIRNPRWSEGDADSVRICEVGSLLTHAEPNASPPFWLARWAKINGKLPNPQELYEHLVNISVKIVDVFYFLFLFFYILELNGCFSEFWGTSKSSNSANLSCRRSCSIICSSYCTYICFNNIRVVIRQPLQKNTTERNEMSDQQPNKFIDEPPCIYYQAVWSGPG